MSSQKMSLLLGELRREMHGAVVESMCYYGDRYGLNYGVSLPTMRRIARSEGVDHKLARLLYRQEVRELRLAALWVADVEQADQERDFWISGIINSEVAEEAAFALIHRCRWAGDLFESNNELHSYCGALSLAKGCDQTNWQNLLLPRWGAIIAALSRHEHLLPRGVVAIMDSLINRGVAADQIRDLLQQLPTSNSSTAYILEEVDWRLNLG